MQHNILEIKNLSKNFGGLAAVSDCSISIKKGSITGIIGPNGSGKTTLFNLIAGNLKSSSGNVIFDNEDITNVPSYELFSKGLNEQGLKKWLKKMFINQQQVLWIVFTKD